MFAENNLLWFPRINVNLKSPMCKALEHQRVVRK